MLREIMQGHGDRLVADHIGVVGTIPLRCDTIESFRDVIANPPDVVLHPDRSVPHAQVVALFEHAPVKPQILAVDENVFSRPGPRIVAAAQRLNAILDGRSAAR